MESALFLSGLIAFIIVTYLSIKDDDKGDHQ